MKKTYKIPFERVATGEFIVEASSEVEAMEIFKTDKCKGHYRIFEVHFVFQKKKVILVEEVLVDKEENE